MVRMMSNDWLQRVRSKRRGSDTTVLDTLFDLPAHEARHILENVRDYDGTKIVEDMDLEKRVKALAVSCERHHCRAGTALGFLRWANPILRIQLWERCIVHDVSAHP